MLNNLESSTSSPTSSTTTTYTTSKSDIFGTTFSIDETPTTTVRYPNLDLDFIPISEEEENKDDEDTNDENEDNDDKNDDKNDNRGNLMRRKTNLKPLLYAVGIGLGIFLIYKLIKNK